MATTYTLAGNATLRDIGNAAIFGVTTARTGGDVYNLNGKTLTIDEDTRYGKSGLSSGVTGNFHLGNITSSTTLGGNLNIDARYVRMIPFTGGSGAVAAGESIAWGGATAKVIGVYSAINVAPALTGVTSGWLKVTEWNGVAFPTSGNYSTPNGWSCTITGADVAGFIEVVGLEGATATIPRLGALNITGAWFSVGTTTGSNADTYQLPTNGSTACYLPGVFVSKTSTPTQDSDYEFYPCVGSVSGANMVGTDEYRGKCCWINQSGVLRFGSDGTNSIGYMPPAGRKIVLPNVLLVNSATATGAANAVPNTTLSTRYDFTTTEGGSISIDKALVNWFPSFAYSSATTISNTAISDQLNLSYNIGQITLTNGGNGFTLAQTQHALRVVSAFAGLSTTDWTCCTQTDKHGFYIDDMGGVTMTRPRSLTFSGTAYEGFYFTRCRDIQITDPSLMGSTLRFDYCTNFRVNNLKFAARIGTGATKRSSMGSANYVCVDGLIDGVSFVDSDSFPTSVLYSAAYYSIRNFEMRNLGSAVTPLDFGGSSCKLLKITSSPAFGIKLRRVWYANTTAEIFSTSNFVDGWQFDNIYRAAGTSDWVNSVSSKNTRIRGVCISALNTGAPSLANGTHWVDEFTSGTAGRIRLLMNEPSAETASCITLGGGAKFTGASGIYMPTIGDSATFEMDYYALGHTGFSSTAVSMGGGTIGNYALDYQIDKNNGAGWSAWTTLTAANLAAETGIDYTKGVKLKLRITTTTANATAITNLTITTTTGATEQQTLYPLESYTLTLTGLASGSDVVVRAAGTSTVLGSVDSISGSTWSYVYQSAQAVDIDVIKPGMVIVPFRNLALTTADSSLPVSQLADRNYL